MKYRKFKIENKNFVISQNEGFEASDVVAYEFAKKLLIGVSSHAMKFNSSNYHFVDYPFTYRERQLDSLILPCISSLCNGLAIAEYPIRRNSRRKGEECENSHGRIDYWCIYKGYTMVIEVKHSYDNLHFTNNKTTKRWKYMNYTQLQNCKKDIRLFTETTHGVIRIGLQFITSRTSDSDNEICEKYKSETKQMFERLVNDMSVSASKHTAPSFLGCWQIEKEYAVADDGFIYPGLILVAKFHELIKHLGCK